MKIIEITKEALKELLEDLGYEVEVKETFEETVETLKEAETNKPS